MSIACPIARAVDALRDAGLKIVETGLVHGTVTVIADGQTIELTQTRIDLDTDGRHAVIGFTDDWAEDARRRVPQAIEELVPAMEERNKRLERERRALERTPAPTSHAIGNHAPYTKSAPKAGVGKGGFSEGRAKTVRRFTCLRRLTRI